MEQARETLRRVFGFADFLPYQEPIIRSVLDGQNVLGVLPTGGGKSLTYQLPALLRGGLTVVISPLKALMRDQVAQMRGVGIRAAGIHTGNAEPENREAERALEEGKLSLLYISPEKALQNGTARRLAAVRPNLLVIDEAHCISHWGHDFRPEYLRLGEFRAALGEVQTMALTATADRTTRAEIAAKLFAGRVRTFVASFDRPNLRLAMVPKIDGTRQLSAFVRGHPGECGIIYCATRARTEELAESLRRDGVDAFAYHAGMEDSRRNEVQDRFQSGDGIVVAATTAFGMGIDKPDVRFVAHADLPPDIESWYQEIGRAGRDRMPAETFTLYGLQDISLRRRQIAGSESDDDRKRVQHQKLEAIIGLCEAPECRRQTLLSYFNEDSGPCGNCDLCLGEAPKEDATVEAQKVLSAIWRTGQRFGAHYVIDVLRGTATELVLQRGHEGLKTFGCGADRGMPEWNTIILQMSAAGLVVPDITRYGVLTITDRGEAVLRGRETFQRRRPTLVRAGKRSRKAKIEATPSGDADAGLYERLRELRARLAKEAGVPSYVVFPDRTLHELAARRPTTMAALAGVHGIGEKKLARYGALFLAVIEEWEAGIGAVSGE